MRYAYGFEFVEDKEDGGYIVYLPAFDAATQGDNMQDAIIMASDLLRFMIEDHILRGEQLPDPDLGLKPQKGGIVIAVVSDVDLQASEDFITATEAAKVLGVTAPRISHMIRDGLLHGYRDAGATLITLDSVNAQKDSPRKAGRPHK